MRIPSGHIPTDLTYIFSRTQRVGQVWDDAVTEESELNLERVTPAFCTDSDNEKTLQTGLEWAQRYAYIWDAVTNTRVEKFTVQQIQKENIPITGIRISSLEVRGNGGRAYKVITPDGFLFDLREDILLDIMRTEGISPGGVLNGSYIWARVASEMKLVRVGSALHTALLEASHRSILSPIPNSKLVVGKVYETKKGDQGIFLGFVSTTRYEFMDQTRGIAHFNAPTHYKTTKKEIKKGQLWMDIKSWQINPRFNKNPETLFVENWDENLYGFSVRMSHSMVKEIGVVTLRPDLLPALRERAKECLGAWVKTNTKPNKHISMSPYHTGENTACYLSDLCFAREANEAPTPPYGPFLLLEERLKTQVSP